MSAARRRGGRRPRAFSSSAIRRSAPRSSPSLSARYAFGAGTAAAALIAILVPGLRVVGLSVALFCALMLLTARFAVMDRIAARRQIRSVLGQPIQLNIREDGILWQGPTATSLVPWNSLTEVRANEQTVLFIGDRLLLASAPAAALASPAERAEVVAYSRSRIEAATTGTENRDVGGQ